MITRGLLPFALALLLSGGTASATSFQGSCTVSGTVSFSPFLTTAARSGDVQANATGRCSGGRTVSVVAQSHGLESCAYGRGSGTGYLAFGDHRLAFSYREVRIGPVLFLEARGDHGGSALAEGNVGLAANPLTILQACASTGLAQAPIDIRLLAPGGISG